MHVCGNNELFPQCSGCYIPHSEIGTQFWKLDIFQLFWTEKRTDFLWCENYLEQFDTFMVFWCKLLQFFFSFGRKRPNVRQFKDLHCWALTSRFSRVAKLCAFLIFSINFRGKEFCKRVLVITFLSWLNPSSVLLIFLALWKRVFTSAFLYQKETKLWS